MVNVKFATSKGVIGLNDLSMGQFEKNAMLGQLAQAKNLKQAEKTINQYLCYSSVQDKVKAFIVWDDTKVIKSISRQFRWVGDNLTGFTLE